MDRPQTIEFSEPAARAAAAALNPPLASPDVTLEDLHGHRMVLNMGPSHPSTHGVLRVVLELDGEVITKANPDVGYLHRGDEKIVENLTYTQFIPYTDRLDYLAPLAYNVAYALAVEKLLGLDTQLPPRCQYIRVKTPVRLLHRARLKGTQDIGTTTWLGQGQSKIPVTGNQGRQVFLLLRFSTILKY